MNICDEVFLSHTANSIMALCDAKTIAYRKNYYRCIRQMEAR